MDAQRFLAEFRHVAGAPNGVLRIRELILHLAITGNLSRRLAGDGLASELVEANRAAQQQLIAAGELKRQAPLRPIDRAELPWSLPRSWMWCRLGELTNYGQSPKVELQDVTGDTWVLELEDIEKGTSRLLQRVRAGERRFQSTKNAFPKGAVLYGKLRPYLDKVLIADEPGVCTTEIATISFFEGVEAAYLRWYLKSPFFIGYASSSTHGMNLPRLGTDVAREALFPLPPLPEQKRIVSKVDALMALCDKLEAQQQQRETLRSTVRKTVLGALTSAQGGGELERAWRRWVDNSDSLIREPSEVEKWRSTILELGATGRLSQPSPSDGSALEVVEAARRAREQQLSGGGPKPRQSPPASILETESTAPAHWAQATVEELFRFIDYRGNTPPKTTSGRILVTAKNVRPGRLEPHPVEYISERGYHEWMTRGFPRMGDLLVTTEAPLGHVARIEAEPTFALAQRVIDLQPYDRRLQTRFFMYFMMSSVFQRQLWANATGTTAKGIKAAKLKRLLLSIPPYEEQERIARTIDRLFALCERLEGQLRAGASLSEDFARARIAAITGVQLGEQDPMKPPKTELVSVLKAGAPPDTKEGAPLSAILTRVNGEMSAKALWMSSGLEIDAFYNQLRTEMSRGWIVQPKPPSVKEVEVG